MNGPFQGWHFLGRKESKMAASAGPGFNLRSYRKTNRSFKHNKGVIFVLCI
jgi:hypothetical protein